MMLMKAQIYDKISVQLGRQMFGRDLFVLWQPTD
jgi:hypothetical protein